MKKASKKLVIFYKAKVLEPIWKENNRQVKNGLNPLGWGEVTKEQTDTLLKMNALIDMSCIEMSMSELQELIVWSFQVGDELGLELDYPQDIELDSQLGDYFK